MRWGVGADCGNGGPGDREKRVPRDTTPASRAPGAVCPQPVLSRRQRRMCRGLEDRAVQGARGAADRTSGAAVGTSGVGSSRDATIADGRTGRGDPPTRASRAARRPAARTTEEEKRIEVRGTSSQASRRANPARARHARYDTQQERRIHATQMEKTTKENTHTTGARPPGRHTPHARRASG